MSYLKHANARTKFITRHKNKVLPAYNFNACVLLPYFRRTDLEGSIHVADDLAGLTL